jgi:hypothetical protein
MAEKLRSVLKIPKLRLGAKAVALALCLYFLPIWAAGILAAAFYFLPTAFSFSFLGTFVSFSVIAGSLYSVSQSIPAALAAGAMFFLLLGVKNVLFVRRPPVFFFLISALIFLALWEFFAGIVSLPILALVVFLFCRDAFSSFTPPPEGGSGRTSLLAAVSALLVSELSWAVFYLNIPVWWATIAVFLVFSGVLYVVVKYLRGSLFRSNAPFIATALAIASVSLLILVSF